jgi:hypothetical protein
MTLDDHMTPWGELMHVHARALGAQPGEWVYHRKFGLGEVLTCETRDGQERIEVRFLRSRARLLALALAPMCRVPAWYPASFLTVAEPVSLPSHVPDSHSLTWQLSCRTRSGNHGLRVKRATAQRQANSFGVAAVLLGPSAGFTRLL